MIFSGPPAPPGVLNVKSFGAAGDGSDATAAFDAAWLAVTELGQGYYNGEATLYGLKGPTLYIPTGTYLYEGDGLPWESSEQRSHFRIVGDGVENTRIELADGGHLLAIDSFVSNFTLKDIQIHGGEGAIRFTHPGANVAMNMVIEDVLFKDYTGTAIGHIATDFPYWRIKRCTFDGAVSGGEYTSMGIALPGLTDGVVIEDCEFWRNRVDIKIGDGGNSAHIVRCSFFRFTTGTTRVVPSTNIWVVPKATGVNAGRGLEVTGCKFGNENLQSIDHRILYANEDDASGADFATRRAYDAADASGFITGHQIHDNAWFASAPTAAIPLVRSYVDVVRAVNISNLQVEGGPTGYIVEFQNPANGDYSTHTNIVGPVLTDSAGMTALGLRASNRPGFAAIIDPHGVIDDNGAIEQAPGSQTPEYVDLLTTAIDGFSSTGSPTRLGVTDAAGGAEAERITTTAVTQIYANLTTAQTAGVPMFFEFDMRTPGAGTPLSYVVANIRLVSGSPYWLRRTRRLPGGWRRYRFSLVPRATTALLVLFELAANGAVEIGRVRVYHDRHAVEPT